MKIKRITYSALLALTVTLYGCAGVFSSVPEPDAIDPPETLSRDFPENPPFTEESATPPKENRPQEKPPSAAALPTIPEVPALLLTCSGKEIGYLKDAEIFEKYIISLTENERSRLEAEGREVISISPQTDYSLSEASCRETELLSEAEMISLCEDAVRPVFTVTVKEYETEDIPFGTVYKNSASYYEGTTVTESAGKNGTLEKTYAVTFTDEKEISRELLSQRTVVEKKDRVILVGTRKSTASTGKYAFPLDHMYVTSGYGSRTLGNTSDFHLGVDLRAAVGTSVYASDGGEIVFAGVSGSYGNLVKIRHDNGDVTYYGHLSKISVSVGSRVYKGQKIAESGATGNVTGPHLHFEIRKNGNTVNPLIYLPKF